MDSQTDPPSVTGEIVAFIRNMFGVRGILLVLAGVLAGFSIGILGTGAIEAPFLGPVPATPVGIVGLAVALITYRQRSCCGPFEDNGCECTDGCGNSCSYDP